MRDTLNFSDLKPGQKFVVLPGEGYNSRLHGDWMKANYLFMRVAGPNGNAVRVCDGRTFAIPEDAPVLRVKDSGRAAPRRRRR